MLEPVGEGAEGSNCRVSGVGFWFSIFSLRVQTGLGRQGFRVGTRTAPRRASEDRACARQDRLVPHAHVAHLRGSALPHLFGVRGWEWGLGFGSSTERALPGFVRGALRVGGWGTGKQRKEGRERRGGDADGFGGTLRLESMICAGPLPGEEVGVEGGGFGVWGLGFEVWGSGFGVWGSGFGFRVWGLGFGVG